MNVTHLKTCDIRAVSPSGHVASDVHIIREFTSIPFVPNCLEQIEITIL